jgi:hypothetical protein
MKKLLLAMMLVMATMGAAWAKWTPEFKALYVEKLTALLIERGAGPFAKPVAICAGEKMPEVLSQQNLQDIWDGTVEPTQQQREEGQAVITGCACAAGAYDACTSK